MERIDPIVEKGQVLGRKGVHNATVLLAIFSSVFKAPACKVAQVWLLSPTAEPVWSQQTLSQSFETPTCDHGCFFSMIHKRVWQSTERWKVGHVEV